jgi:dihydroneopterin aldolase
VHAVSDSRQFQLLEIFAAAIADRVVAELTVEHVRVRVRKPGVQWALHTAATVERP